MAYVIVIFGTLIAVNLGVGTWLSEGHVAAGASQGAVDVENIASPQSIPHTKQ